MPNVRDLNCIVLYISSLTGIGGEERLLFEEEKFFGEKGIETVILTFYLDRRALYDYCPERLEIIESGNSHLSRLFALRKKLKELKPSLVIAQSLWGCMLLYLATLFTSIPYITHIHGTFFWFSEDTMKYTLIFRKVFSEIRESVIGHKEFIPAEPQWALKERMYQEVRALVNYFAVRKSRKLIVLTNQLKWEVEKLYRREAVVARGCLSPDALFYQPNQNIKQKLGLDRKRIILSIGRLDPRKRIDVLIKAFGQILSKYDNLFLLIGGKGKEEEYLKKLAKDRGVAERVKFLGFIPDSELFDYYAACDVFAFPSWTSSGITPYEALAVGKKAVWTTEADEPILDDKHVFLADPTIDEFAKGLQKALDTHVEGKIDLSNYTWEKYFETVYSAAIGAVNNKALGK